VGGGGKIAGVCPLNYALRTDFGKNQLTGLTLVMDRQIELQTEGGGGVLKNKKLTSQQLKKSHYFLIYFRTLSGGKLHRAEL
jgi:hypothetical protein